MKKIIYVVILLLVCFMCNKKTYAMSGRLEKMDFIYKTYNTNGSDTYTRNSSYKLFVDDNLTYCISPGVLFREGDGYYEGIYEGLTDEQLRKIQLINYYGYGFFYHTTIEYYLATQEMIHNVLGYTTTYNDGMYTVDDKKRDIKYFVDRHELVPTIDDDIYVMPDTQEYFVDENSTLGEFVIETSSNVTYGIDANKLVVRLMSGDEGYIRFYKGNDIPNRFYIKDNSQIVATFGLEKELRKEIKVHKAQTGKIDVTDIDIATLEGIQGSVYNLLDADGNILETKSTNEYGYLIFDNYYRPGSYYVEEESLINYEKNNDKYYINLDSDLSSAWFFHGNLGSINIINVDKFGNILNGKFKITNEYGNVIDGTDLIVGNYSVKQIASEEGYYIDNNVYNIQLTKDNLNQELTVVNYLPDGSIRINNVNEDGEILSGDFEVKQDENTVLDLNSLDPGDYYVRQVGVSDGYYIDTNTYNVKLTKSNLNQEITIVNKLITGSVDVKIIGEDDSKIIGEYVIYNEYGNEYLNTDLVPGKYYVKQIKTQDEYIMDENIYEVDITLDDLNQELVIINKLKKGNIIIKNIDEDENILDGEFDIYDVENNRVDYNDLLPGVYYIRQVGVSDGYQIDNNIYEVNITLDDLEKEVTVINSKIVPIIPKTSGYGYSFIVVFILIAIGIIFKRIKCLQ